MYYYIVNLTSTAKNNRTHVVFGAKLEAEIEKFKTIYKLEKNFAKLTKELLGLIVRLVFFISASELNIGYRNRAALLLVLMMVCKKD